LPRTARTPLDDDDEVGQLRVREWLSWEANRISLNLSHPRFGRRWGDYHPEVLAWYDRRAHDDLDRMEGELTSQPYLASRYPTIADVACCGYLYFIDEGRDGETAGVAWADAAGIDLTRWPRVRAWLQRMAGLRGFQAPQRLSAGHEAARDPGL
jgi:glutathione S-transferase